MIKKGILIVLFGIAGVSQSLSQTNNKIIIDKDIQLIHLQDSIYVHVTWHQLKNFGRISSNGLIIIKNAQALMIETPMDNSKTEKLTKYLKDSLSVDLTKLIIGHFHDDSLGGLEYLNNIGIESIANSMTIEKCKENGLPIPSTLFTNSLTIDFNGEQIQCRFFGAGHSFDNITVWIPNKKILFGGCLIRSSDSLSLGNLSDAVVTNWDLTIKKIMEEYTKMKTVIPGHGNFGGTELLSHTIKLVERQKNKSK